MHIIKNTEFGGERPLFASHDLQLEHVTIHAGESALKECSHITAIGCRFEGKYPFWHVNGFTIKDCLFTEGARAALWYSQTLVMTDTRVEAPKMFREMENLIQRLLLCTEGDVITEECLRREFRKSAAGNRRPQPEPVLPPPASGGDEEARYRAAAAACGSTREMARVLRTSQSTVVRKLRKYGLQPGGKNH